MTELSKAREAVQKNRVADSYILHILRGIGLILFLFSVLCFYNVRALEREGKSTKYVIIGLTINGRSKDILVNRESKEYVVGYNKEDYYQLKVGDSILLYYNEQYDYFYLPNTLGLYKRYIIASFCFLVFFLICPYIKGLGASSS